MARAVLVTGATGFIGSHLVERLLETGVEVRCLVRRTSSRRYLPLASIRIWEGDLATGEGLREAAEGVAAVFHLAGTTKALHKADYHSGNVAATEAVLETCGEVPRLVHVSSLAAAGPNPDGVPLDEDAAPRPLTTYGRTKLEAETLVRNSALAPRSVIVRPPVVYGPRDTDVLHFFRAASRGWLPSVGKDERFFSAIYVKDLVKGLIAAATCPGAAGKTYYMADPNPYSWSAFGATVASVMGRRARRLAAPRALAWAAGLSAEAFSRIARRPGIISREKMAEAGCRYWTCDPSRAARELGFAAETTLRDGVTETLAWYRQMGWLR